MDDVKECMTVVIALCIEATRESNGATDSLATEIGDDTEERGGMDRRGIGDGILAGGGDSGLGAGGKEGDKSRGAGEFDVAPCFFLI